MTLSSQQIRGYHDDGYIILRGVFTADEIARALAEAERLWERTDLIDPHNVRVRYQTHATTGASVFDVYDPVFDIAPILAGLGRSQRMLAALSDLFGEQACHFKDKLIFKSPGVNGANLHQDWISWASFPLSYTASIIALDPFDRENGCPEVFPGCHKFGYLSPTDGLHHRLTVEQLPVKETVPLILAAGDVAVFGGFMPHRSPPNFSTRWRRGLFTSFNAYSHGGEQYEAHYAEYNPWRQKLRPVEEQPLLFFR